MPPRSQITDLVRFVVLNIYVFSLLSVLFPVQAKPPKRLHMYLTALYNKIYQVKSVIRFPRPDSSGLWGCLVRSWCSKQRAQNPRWLGPQDGLSAAACVGLCPWRCLFSCRILQANGWTDISLQNLRALSFCHIINLLSSVSAVF